MGDSEPPDILLKHSTITSEENLRDSKMDHPTTPSSIDGGPGLRVTASDEQAAEITTENQSLEKDQKDSDSLMSDDEGQSMLDTLSSEQLARRPSFKKILDDLSAADQTLQKPANPDLLSSAAVLQAQQLQAALQQVASTSGLTNTSLLPGLLQGGTSTASSGDQISSQLSVMLPAQQQIQLQSALLQSMNASPGVMQSLASQNNIPASLISSALINANMAATLNGSSSTSNMATGMKIGQAGSSNILDDSNRKREVRLMKNREAARECRRKKKEYVRCLESRVAVLESQNQALIGELRALKELYLPKSQDN